ncbi:MAG: formyltransferase family protein [Armatimonadota bacterium]
MKIAILTTQTSHHAYFVQEISKKYPVDIVIVEKNTVKPKFDVYHSFENQRDKHEKELFFKGADIQIKDIANTLEVDKINDKEAVECLKELKPDIIIVYGTRKISEKIIDICPEGIINLHGADPQQYRGLDSYLWAVYHDDFESFFITLHRVNNELDDGEIILQEKISLTKRTSIIHFRSLSAVVCVKLVLSALGMYEKDGCFISHPQKKTGCYYSFMPSELKEVCVGKFKKYTESIK